MVLSLVSLMITSSKYMSFLGGAGGALILNLWTRYALIYAGSHLQRIKVAKVTVRSKRVFVVTKLSNIAVNDFQEFDVKKAARYSCVLVVTKLAVSGTQCNSVFNQTAFTFGGHLRLRSENLVKYYILFPYIHDSLEEPPPPKSRYTSQSFVFLF